MVEGSLARLESFSYEAFQSCEININLASRKSLKSFILEGVHITDEWFRNQVSELVSLENLSLRYCKIFMKNMCINNEHLKCLQLVNCGPLEGIDISVSGLESFECDCYPLNTMLLGKILIKGCTFLKNLTLRCVRITDKLIEDNFVTSCCDKHTDKTMTFTAICKKIDQNNIL